MKNKTGFTLIEIIVSISILSIIMISIFMIFNLSADLNNRTDVSRSLQENIKNIEQIISQDLTTNKINWVNNNDVIWNCNISSTMKYSSWTKLCIWNNSYYLAKKLSWVWIRIIDYNECNNKSLNCYLVKDNWTQITQLSNSWVHFNNLYFYVTNTKTKKVTIIFEIQPSLNKWIRINLINRNKINFETTISEKLYNN